MDTDCANTSLIRVPAYLRASDSEALIDAGKHTITTRLRATTGSELNGNLVININSVVTTKAVRP